MDGFATLTRREWLAGAAAAGLAAGCSRALPRDRSVTVYVSLDQPYAEPVLKKFEADSGIRVRAVYDLEKDKSVGLTDRLFQERKDPAADVFWNNEAVNTVRLAREDVFAPYRSPAAEDLPAAFRDAGGLWTGFAGRARVIIYNTEKVGRNPPPKTLAQLAVWAEKPNRAVVARPVAGTTATHVAALFALAGPELAKSELSELKRRGVSFDAAANSVVARLVADGEYAVGLTDTDDYLEQVKAGKGVGLVFPTGEQPWEKLLVIPNAVSLVKGGPNPEAARKLIDFLLGRRVEQMLAAGPSAQIPLRADLELPKSLPGLTRNDWAPIDFDKAADHREAAAAFVNQKLLA